MAEAIKTNTVVTYDQKGLREDLSDVIYNISPSETPFLQNAGKGKAKAVLFEWQVDALAATDGSNAHIEGDDIETTGFDAGSVTTRVGNYCQISRKTCIVSGTQEAVDKAGRKSEMAYQMAKRSKELKRDMETIALSNQACVSGAADTARKTGGLIAWLKTNVDKANDGTNPTGTTVPNDARNDGTPRAFTEAMLKNAIQLVWTAGGTPKILQVGPINKQNVSKFAGIAETRVNVKSGPTTIIGSADVYVSDFGEVHVVPNRYQRESDAILLDPEYVEIAYLRPFQQVDVAKTGDAEKRVILAEWGLKVKNEAALGLVADLTNTITA